MYLPEIDPTDRFEKSTRVVQVSCYFFVNSAMTLEIAYTCDLTPYLSVDRSYVTALSCLFNLP